MSSVAVELTASGREFLRHNGLSNGTFFTPVEVWFVTDNDSPDGRPTLERPSSVVPEVHAYVGTTEVGTVPAAAVPRLLPDIRVAAELYDEQAYARGILLTTDHTDVEATLLQISLPPPPSTS